MLTTAKKATCHTFLCALAFASLASGQVVEKARTWADLNSSHPCDTGLTGRLARVTDCDAADDVGDGAGAFNCWVSCDGSAPWVTQAIGAGGGGAGVSGLDTADGGTAIADNVVIRGDGATGIQGSTVTLADSTGNLQWEGTTADAFEGNFTFADPTADWTWAWGADGALTGATQFNLENLRLDGNTISSTNTNGNINLEPNGTGVVVFPATVQGFGFEPIGNLATYGIGFQTNGTVSMVANGNAFAAFLSTQEINFRNSLTLRWGSGTSADPDYIGADTGIERSAAGIVAITNASTGGGALHLNPLASPPRTCDATAEGDIYADTSHALCFCDGTSWNVLTGSGAGTCA